MTERETSNRLLIVGAGPAVLRPLCIWASLYRTQCRKSMPRSSRPRLSTDDVYLIERAGIGRTCLSGAWSTRKVCESVIGSSREALPKQLVNSGSPRCRILSHPRDNGSFPSNLLFFEIKSNFIISLSARAWWESRWNLRR